MTSSTYEESYLNLAEKSLAKAEFVAPKGFVPLLDLGNKELNGNPTMLYSAIYNRWGSSVQHDEFYDKKEKKYFVIYEYTELAELINSSTKTVSRIVNKLCDLGFLKKKRCLSGVYKLFPTPTTDLKQRIANGRTFKKEKSNKNAFFMLSDIMSSRQNNFCPHNYLNFSYLSYFFINAIKSTKLLQLFNPQSYPQANKKITPVPTINHNNSTKKDKTTPTLESEQMAVDSYISTMLDKVEFPSRTMSIIKSLVGRSFDKINLVIGSIMRAKKAIYQHIKYTIDTPLSATSFGDNGFIQEHMAATTQRIIYKTFRNTNIPVEKRGGYLFKSFYSFFNEAARNYCYYGKPEDKDSPYGNDTWLR